MNLDFSPDDISRGNALHWMLLVLFISFATMLPMLNLQISHDELASITKIGFFDKASGPLEIAALVQKYTPVHVPLYYIIESYWAGLVGFSALPLRLSSLLTGLGLLAFVYRLAADTFDRRVAVLAALLFSFSSLAATRFHIIRMFPMVMLLAVMHTWLYWRLAHGKGGRGRDWLAFVLSGSALVYAHAFAPLIVAGLGLHHLFLMGRTRRWRRILLGWALAFALALPALPLLASGIAFNSKKFSEGAAQPSQDLLVGLGTELVNFAPVLWLPLAVGIGLALRADGDRTFAKLCFVSLAGTLILVAFDSTVGYMDLRRLRYFLPLWPVAIILVASALNHLPWRRLMVTVFVMVWVAAGYNLVYGPPESQPVWWTYRIWANLEGRYPPFQRHAAALRGKTHRSDHLLYFGVPKLAHEVHRITGGSFADYYLAQEFGLDSSFLPASDKKYRLRRDVEAIMAAQPAIIVAGDPSVDMPNHALALYHIKKVFMACPPLVDEADMHFQRYTHPVIGCDHAPAEIVDFANGMRLLDRALWHDADAGSLEALLWWEIPDESNLDDYNISLQLFDSNGEKVGQNDYHLDEKRTPWGVVELATDDLSPGDYRLKLILYNRHDGARVSGIDAATGKSMAMLPLHEIKVSSS